MSICLYLCMHSVSLQSSKKVLHKNYISLGGPQFPSILTLSVSYCLRVWIQGKVFPSSSDFNVTDFRTADRAALFLIGAHLLLDGKGWDYVIPHPFCRSCLWEALTRFFHFILSTGRCLKLCYFCQYHKDKLLAVTLFAPNGSGCISRSFGNWSPNCHDDFISMHFERIQFPIYCALCASHAWCYQCFLNPEAQRA